MMKPFLSTLAAIVLGGLILFGGWRLWARHEARQAVEGMMLAEISEAAVKINTLQQNLRTTDDANALFLLCADETRAGEQRLATLKRIKASRDAIAMQEKLLSVCRHIGD